MSFMWQVLKKHFKRYHGSKVMVNGGVGISKSCAESEKVGYPKIVWISIINQFVDELFAKHRGSRVLNISPSAQS